MHRAILLITHSCIQVASKMPRIYSDCIQEEFR
jgi:hypothetical protein